MDTNEGIKTLSLISIIFLVISILPGCTLWQNTAELPTHSSGYEKLTTKYQSAYKYYIIKDSTEKIIAIDSTFGLPLVNQNYPLDTSYLFVILRDNRIPEILIDMDLYGSYKYVFKVSDKGKIYDVQSSNHNYMGQFFLKEIEELSEKYLIASSEYFENKWTLRIILME